jgi:outer membrane scaffolding protein for murein synthesis (MipA/OmpV family)
MKHAHLLPVALTGLLTVALTSSASAQVEENGQAKLPLWEVGAGVGVLVAPAYLGSSVTRAYAAPWPYFVYRGERLHANREGVGASLIATDRLKLDLSISGALPVRSSGTAREGMRDLPLVGEVGPVLKYALVDEDEHRWSIRLPIRYGMGVKSGGLESVGWIADPTLRGTETIKLFGKNVDWGVDFSVKFQDRRFNNFYYRVTPAEATANRAAFEATGGFSGVSVNTGLLARFDDVVVGGFIGASDLAGSRIAHSSLVEQKTNVYGGIAVFWIFSKSSQTSGFKGASN